MNISASTYAGEEPTWGHNFLHTSSKELFNDGRTLNIWAIPG